MRQALMQKRYSARSAEQKALDHALANIAMGEYRMSYVQLEAAKGHESGTYELQIGLLEAHENTPQAVTLAARMVLEAAGYRQIPIDAPLKSPESNQKQETGHAGEP